MRVLDIGCGWGGAAKFAAERYGVSVTGVTISRNQADAAKSVAEDCRSDSAPADSAASQAIRPDLFARHVRARRLAQLPRPTSRAHARAARARRPVPAAYHRPQPVRQTNNAWIERYIFPNSMLPSMAQIAHAAEGLFLTEDWHSFGPDYDRTLMPWHELSRRLAPDRTAVRRALPPHVGVLAAQLRGIVSRPAQPAVADGAVTKRSAGGTARGALMGAFIQSPPRLGNQYDDDALLRSLLRRLCRPDVLAAIEPELTRAG